MFCYSRPCARLDEQLAEKVSKMFTDEETSALLFQRGEIIFDVKEQLLLKYGGKVLRYEESEFLRRFAMQLENQSQLVRKIIVAKNYKYKLLDLDNTKEVYEAERITKSDQNFESEDHLMTAGSAKTLDFDRSDRYSTDSMISDGRTGNAERSDDYSIESD